MFARSRQLFATGMFAVDAVLFAVAWLGAYWLRFHALGLPTPLGVPPLSLYLWSGAVLTPTPLVDGWVYSVIPDGSGGWYLGGNFSQVNGFNRVCLVHLLPNMTTEIWSLTITAKATNSRGRALLSHSLPRYAGVARSTSLGRRLMRNIAANAKAAAMATTREATAAGAFKPNTM